MDKDQGVTVAKSAGFCPGVKNAIDKVLALESAGKRPIYTLGPLIHNKQVTDMLAAKQITSVNTPQEATDKSGVLVIRAHGISPAFRAEVMQSEEYRQALRQMMPEADISEAQKMLQNLTVRDIMLQLVVYNAFLSLPVSLLAALPVREVKRTQKES